MSFNFVQNQPTTLAGAGNSIGDTTLVLSSLLAIDGSTTLTMTNFGSVGYGTLEPGNGTQEEQISFTGITQNSNGTATLTGVKTVLFISPYTETSGLAKTHPGGSQFVVSNTAGFYNKFAVLSDTGTITAQWQFPNDGTTPILGTSYVAPTADTQVASKKYVDTVAIYGAPLASTTTAGIVQEASQTEVDAKTQTGSTGAKLFQNLSTQRSTQLSDYVASDTGSANAYAIAPSPSISAYAAGQQFSFKAAHANTTTSTLAVSGLTAKTIKKLGNTTDLLANDILANQVVNVIYDGTNFQLLNPVGNNFVDLTSNQTIATGTKVFTTPPQSNTPSSASDLAIKGYVDNVVAHTNGSTTKNAADASTTQNIAHGLGRTPNYVRLTAIGQTIVSTTNFKGFMRAETVYNGTTQSSLSTLANGTTNADTTTTFVLNTDTAGGSESQAGVVTVTSTNIVITWTKTGSPTGTYNIMWEAM